MGRGRRGHGDHVGLCGWGTGRCCDCDLEKRAPTAAAAIAARVVSQSPSYSCAPFLCLSLLSRPRFVFVATCARLRARHGGRKETGCVRARDSLRRFSLPSRATTIDAKGKKTQTHHSQHSRPPLSKKKKKTPVAQEAHATPEAQAPPTALEVDWEKRRTVQQERRGPRRRRDGGGAGGGS